MLVSRHVCGSLSPPQLFSSGSGGVCVEFRMMLCFHRSEIRSFLNQREHTLPCIFVLCEPKNTRKYAHLSGLYCLIGVCQGASLIRNRRLEVRFV